MRSAGRQYKNAIYEQFARIAKALSSPKRLELVDLLAQGERSVEALAQEANLTVANTSQHLQTLRHAQLVDTERNGHFVTYRLSNYHICDFLGELRALAEGQLSEIEHITRNFLAGKEGMEPVDADTLLQRVRAGAVTVLDVRPPEEFRAGHIPGAISIPLKELERHLADLPRDQEIVAYCRGPYCVLAIRAVEILRAQGFHAARLQEGVPDWRAKGLPVAAGDEPA